MPTVDDILTELKELGKESYKRTMMKYGAPEAYLGVSVADMKKIQKRVKTDHALALGLYDLVSAMPSTLLSTSVIRRSSPRRSFRSGRRTRLGQW